MSYLKRLSYRPRGDDLKVSEAEYVLKNFDVAATSVIVNHNQEVFWRMIDEVEVVKSARIVGPAGWFVRFFLHNNEDRYHVGIYFADDEAVLTNVPYSVMEYVVKMIAYYVPQRVRYTGPAVVALED